MHVQFQFQRRVIDSGQEDENAENILLFDSPAAWRASSCEDFPHTFVVLKTITVLRLILNRERFQKFNNVLLKREKKEKTVFERKTVVRPSHHYNEFNTLHFGILILYRVIKSIGAPEVC